MRTRLLVPVLLTSLVVASACKNTADGLKQDASIAAEKTAEAGSKAGDAVGGGIKTADVKTALMADSLITGSDIDVDTNHETRTVTLSGTVASETIRTRAGQVATDNATGYTVVNNLMVKSR